MPIWCSTSYDDLAHDVVVVGQVVHAGGLPAPVAGFGPGRPPFEQPPAGGALLEPAACW
jgi:hypothetical protein